MRNYTFFIVILCCSFNITNAQKITDEIVFTNETYPITSTKAIFPSEDGGANLRLHYWNGLNGQRQSKGDLMMRCTEDICFPVFLLQTPGRNSIEQAELYFETFGRSSYLQIFKSGSFVGIKFSNLIDGVENGVDVSETLSLSWGGFKTKDAFFLLLGSSPRTIFAPSFNSDSIWLLRIKSETQEVDTLSTYISPKPLKYDAVKNLESPYCRFEVDESNNTVTHYFPDTAYISSYITGAILKKQYFPKNTGIQFFDCKNEPQVYTRFNPQTEELMLMKQFWNVDTAGEVELQRLKIPEHAPTYVGYCLFKDSTYLILSNLKVDDTIKRCFISVYNSNGSMVGSASLYPSRQVEGHAVAIDSLSRVYITGFLLGDSGFSEPFIKRIDDLALGRNAPASLKEIVIFPNPVEDKLLFKAISGDFSYQIMDVSGRIVQSGYPENIEANDYSIALANQSSGGYFLQLIYAGGNEVYPVKRFLVK